MYPLFGQYLKMWPQKNKQINEKKKKKDDIQEPFQSIPYFNKNNFLKIGFAKSLDIRELKAHRESLLLIQDFLSIWFLKTVCICCFDF